jgi:hypothetical protein
MTNPSPKREIPNHYAGRRSATPRVRWPTNCSTRTLAAAGRWRQTMTSVVAPLRRRSKQSVRTVPLPPSAITLSTARRGTAHFVAHEGRKSHGA